ncbi:hypothetical protein QYG89_06315 [Bacillus sp. B190/17]|uniref:Uncharacterized protein n=1 Tax=Bacillus lumedeiriae TaxID=3058829 RepID=A0ABW8I737_9BACI
MSIIFFNKIFVKTSSMAIVMALGIMIHGVLFHIAAPYLLSIKIASLLTIALWLTFSFSIILASIHRKFASLHTAHPMNRFGIGTWIAGTSICSILIFKHFDQWRPAAIALSYIIVGLWLFYLQLSFRSFYHLHHSPRTERVHGILLLTTVSTQSIVLLMNTMYEHIPIVLDRTLIGFGLMLYAISFFFIIRHRFTPGWTVEDHWANTNCILHGALSITGFACVVSDAVSVQLTLSLWIFVVMMFVLVEAIEIQRLMKRLNRDGFKQGLWIYDVTQWSRLFTFGMFYTFTSLVNPQTDFLVRIKNTILIAGVPVIFLLFIIEVLIYTPFVLQVIRKAKLQTFQDLHNHQASK